MRKIETNITVNNYTDYATLTYIPFFFNDLKNRVRITDAVLSLNIKNFNNQKEKISVYFIDSDKEYLVDELDLSNNKSKVHIWLIL